MSVWQEHNLSVHFGVLEFQRFALCGVSWSFGVSAFRLVCVSWRFGVLAFRISLYLAFHVSHFAILGVSRVEKQLGETPSGADWLKRLLGDFDAG